MLVLNRKKDEAVIITCPDGTRITVMVCEVHRDEQKVRLGFDAPLEYMIHREEIQELIDEEAARAGR